MDKRIADNLRDFARKHHTPRIGELADRLERAVLGMAVNMDVYDQIKSIAEQARALDWASAPPAAKAALTGINARIAEVNRAVPAAYRIEPI